MSFAGGCALLFAIMAFCMIKHPKYEDGLIGRLALWGIIVSCIFVVLMEWKTGRYDVPPELAMLLVSLFVFMARHFYRFLRFQATGRYTWGKPEPKETICRT